MVIGFFCDLKLQLLLCQANPYSLSYPPLLLKFFLSRPKKHLGLEIQLVPLQSVRCKTRF